MLGLIRGIMRRVLCHHESLEFRRNIYGDEINAVSLTKIYRSWWECRNCGQWVPKPELMPDKGNAA